MTSDVHLRCPEYHLQMKIGITRIQHECIHGCVTTFNGIKLKILLF